MSEIERKRIGKTKIGLVVCAVLVAILAVSNLWFSLRINTLEIDRKSLQGQMSGLQSDKTTLQSQIISLGRWLDGNKTSLTKLEEDYSLLNDVYNTLNSAFASLQSEHDSLQSEYTSLQRNYAYLEEDYTVLEEDYENVISEYVDLLGNHTHLLMYVDRSLESKSTPSISELQSWLFLDQTNLLGYHNDFDCKDFSVLLSVKARTNHWDMGIASIYGYDVNTEEYYAHAFNFIITNEGLVYVEPQTDDIWWYSDHEKIEVGITYEIGHQWIMVETIDIVAEGN